jgi:hypothetical protein
VSIFNFHYASPPDAVRENWALGKALGDNETGFKGTADRHYRMEGWESLLAGGALYNHLDYSFVAGQEDGSFEYPASQPGGGGKRIRRQLGFLKRFIEGLPIVDMVPSPEKIRGGVPEGQRAWILTQGGKAPCALYLTGGGRATLRLDLPRGAYRVEWFDPRSGERTKAADLDHGDGQGPASIESPAFEEDAALAITRRD